ncbi:hypothetical protein WJX73_004662 [Symbiochloris irregularis]|uniref:Uncharacterized protein n=1 Tax=Symbiochloris irregularis TaxID=706552 RepID=A0AAW1NP55_9CHLO
MFIRDVGVDISAMGLKDVDTLRNVLEGTLAEQQLMPFYMKEYHDLDPSSMSRCKSDEQLALDFCLSKGESALRKAGADSPYLDLRGMLSSMAFNHGIKKQRTAFVHDEGFTMSIVITVKGLKRTPDGIPLMEITFMCSTA